jgi:small-conductance mechanosensitive channel
MKQFYLVVCLLVFVSLGLQAQGGGRSDSTRKDTAHTAENLILQRKEQSLIDSAVRRQLQLELKAAAGNAATTRELQAQLDKIAVDDSLRMVAQLQRIDSLKKITRGFPVILDRDTLFYLYTKTGSFSAADRAEAISGRIARLDRNYVFSPDSLRLIATDNGYDITYKSEMTVMSISGLDALWLNTATDSLAKAYHGRIIAAIIKERRVNNLESWVKRIGLTAMILVVAALLIFGFNGLFKRFDRFIRDKRGKYGKGLTVRRVNIVTAEKMEQFALSANRLLRVLCIVICGYLALLLCSGLYTATEKWTNTLLSWIITPARSAAHSAINFLPNLFTILVIYLIFKYTIRGLQYFSNEIQGGRIQLTGFHQEWAHPTYNIIKFLLYAFMIILIFPHLPGSNSPSFKGVSVFLGVLISLGSSSAISNMVAGLVITYMRPFKIGDRVKIGEITGDVMEKNMLVTRIRTIKNEDITVPNSTVLSNNTINYSANTRPEEKGLILHTTVTIGYNTPWKEMHKALIAAAGRTEHLLTAPAPFVLQTSLDDFFVSYQLNAYTREANKQATIYSELHQHIQDCCNEAGIEIMSPHYQSMRDGNATTIPSDYLSKDYEAPPFVVKEKEKRE